MFQYILCTKCIIQSDSCVRRNPLHLHCSVFAIFITLELSHGMHLTVLTVGSEIFHCYFCEAKSRLVEFRYCVTAVIQPS